MKSLTKLKTSTQIKREKPYYFVSINGENLFESESLSECKKFMVQYVKDHKKEIIEQPYNYFIGMYNIDVED